MKKTTITAALLMGLAASHAELPEPVAPIKPAEQPAELTLDQATEQAFLRGVARGKELSPEQTLQMKQRFVLMKNLAQQAIEHKLDQDITTRANLELRRLQTLAQLYIADWAKNNEPTEAQVKALYEKRAPRQADKAKYEASHILLATEDDAKKVLAELAAGGDFAALAKKHSTDPGSGESGGDLGSFTAEVMIPEFVAALQKMKVGETSAAPVKSEFGYHIIRFTGMQEAKLPTYEEIAPKLRQELHNRMVQSYITSLQAAPAK